MSPMTESKFQNGDYVINTTFLVQDQYIIRSSRPIRDCQTDEIIGHLYFSNQVGRDLECIFGIISDNDSSDWILVQQR